MNAIHPERPTGEWARRALSWWETPDSHCELCGRPLPGRRYVVADAGEERSFCGTDCAELSRTRTASA